ncbi:unnamed protein product [Miscanthus lutarioriparius]|uniref:Secreted protein n=1 Tax=Miscanthus lutarioriparius TaxID=422564 RepID=A0A811QLC9_9POAL|nr:unnamed protein product [Miscanthus lutarioriparius]
MNPLAAHALLAAAFPCPLVVTTTPDVELGTSTAPERRPCWIQCLQGSAEIEIYASVPCLRGVHYRPFSSFLQPPLAGVAAPPSLLPPEARRRPGLATPPGHSALPDFAGNPRRAAARRTLRCARLWCSDRA